LAVDNIAINPFKAHRAIIYSFEATLSNTFKVLTMSLVGGYMSLLTHIIR